MNEENELNKAIKKVFDITQNSVLKARIENLKKIGFTEEIIVDLVYLKTGFSENDSEEALEQALMTVTNDIIKTVTENLNGLVLKDDGSIDENKSKIQQEKLEEINDVYSRYSLSEETIGSIIEKISSNYNEENIQYDDKLYNIYNYFGNILSDEDRQKADNIAGITKEDREQNENNEEYAYLKTNIEVDFIGSLYVLKKELNEKNIDIDKINLARKDFKNNLLKIKEIRPDFYRKFESFGDEIPDEIAMQFLDEWQNLKNESDILGDLEEAKEFILRPENFKNASVSHQCKVMITLARALEHVDDNAEIRKIVKVLESKIDMKISKETIISFFREKQGIDLSDEENYSKYISDHDITEKNYERKLGRYRRSNLVAEENGISKMSAKERQKLINKHIRSMTLGDKEIRDALDQIMFTATEKNSPELEILYVLQRYQENKKVSTTIKHYIYEHRDQFRQHFLEEDDINIFDDQLNNGNSIVSKRVEELLSKRVLKIESTNRINKCSEVIDSVLDNVRETREKEKEKVKEIRKILNYISKENNNDRVDKIERLKELVEQIDVYALDEKIIEKLRSINTDAIDILNDKLGIRELTEEDLIKGKIIYENVLTLEALVELSKDDPSEFAINVQKRDEIYSKSKEMKQESLKYKDQNGKLNDIGKRKIDEYIDNLSTKMILEKIESVNIDELDKNERNNYISLLIAGTKSNDLNIKNKAVQEFIKIYPDLEKIKSKDIENEIYRKVFGNLSKEELEKKAEKTKNNFKLSVIKSKTILDIDKESISNIDFEDFFGENSVDLKVLDMDFTQSTSKRLFSSKNVSFSLQDEKIYQNFLRSVTIGSWIGSRNDCIKQVILNLENRKNNRSKESDIFNNILKKLLENNPQFDTSQIFDSDGNVLPSAQREGEVFREKYLYSEALAEIGKTLENTKDYSSMNNDEKKEALDQALLVYELSQRVKKQENKNTLLKLSNMLFDKISKDELRFYDSKTNKINEELILKEYFKLDSKEVSDIKQLQKNIRQSTLRVDKLKSYLWLREDEFLSLDGYSEEEKYRIVIEKRNEFVEKRKVCSQRREDFRNFQKIKDEVSQLAFNDLKKINNKYVYAIYIKSRIEDGANINADSVLKTYMEDDTIKFDDVTKELGENLLEKIGKDVFDDIIQSNRSRRKQEIFEFFGDSNRVGRDSNGLVGNISNFSKQTIDELANIDVSAIWYYNAIQNATRKNQPAIVEKLQKEFALKFPDSPNIDNKIEEIKEKVSNEIDGNFFEGEPNNGKVMKKILGEEAYEFVRDNKDINKKFQKDETAMGYKILRESLGKIDEKTNVEVLATLFKEFSKMESSGEDKCNGTEIIEKYMLCKKRIYRDFLKDDYNIDFEKLLTHAKDDIDPKSKNIKQKLINGTNDQKEENERLNKKFEVVKTLIGKKRNSAENHEFYAYLKELLDKNEKGKIFSEEMLEELQEKETGNYLKATLRNGQRKQDTWSGFIKRAVSLGGKAVKEFPKVISGKESKMEFAKKLLIHTANGMERIGGKVQKDFGKEGRKKFATRIAVNRIKNKKRLNSNEKKALPEGNQKLGDKNNQRKSQSADKATNNQNSQLNNESQQSFDQSIKVNGLQNGICEQMAQAIGNPIVVEHEEDTIQEQK